MLDKTLGSMDAYLEKSARMVKIPKYLKEKLYSTARLAKTGISYVIHPKTEIITGFVGAVGAITYVESTNPDSIFTDPLVSIAIGGSLGGLVLAGHGINRLKDLNPTW